MKKLLFILVLLSQLAVGQDPRVRGFKVVNSNYVSTPVTTSDTLAYVDVIFSGTPPAALSTFADGKYNKSKGFMIAQDDSKIGDYVATFQYHWGDSTAVDGKRYPRRTYSDGAGRQVPVRYTFGVIGRGVNGEDIHNGANNTIASWDKYRKMFAFGFADISNHTKDHGAGSTYWNRLEQVKGGEKLFWDKLGVKTRTLIIPADNEGFAETSISLGYGLVGSQFGGNTVDGNNTAPYQNIQWQSRVPMPLTNAAFLKLLSNRSNLGDEWTDANLIADKAFVDGILNGSSKYMGHAFSHGPTTAAHMTNYNAFWQYIFNHPSYADNVWFAGMQEFYEYYETARQIVKIETRSGNTLRITLNYSKIDKNNRFRDVSLLVPTGTAIQSISVVGGDSSSYNVTTGLVNIYKRKNSGFTDPALDVRPPNMVSAVANTNDPKKVKILFDRPVTQSVAAGYGTRRVVSVTNNVPTYADNAVTGLTGSGTSWTITVTDSIKAGQTWVLDYRIGPNPTTTGNAVDAATGQRVVAHIAMPVTLTTVALPAATSQYTLTINYTGLPSGSYSYDNFELVPGNQYVYPAGTVVNNITPTAPGWTFTPASYSNLVMDGNKTLTFTATQQ